MIKNIILTVSILLNVAILVFVGILGYMYTELDEALLGLGFQKVCSEDNPSHEEFAPLCNDIRGGRYYGLCCKHYDEELYGEIYDVTLDNSFDEDLAQRLQEFAEE